MNKLIDYTPREIKELLDKALSIDNSSGYALDNALKEHSKLHNDWTFLAAQANSLLQLEEVKLKQTVAEVIGEIRREHAEGGKPLAQTYPIEKELLPLDERWKKAYRRVIELREYVDILAGVERKFNNRAWLLIQLAKGREGEFEPSVKGKRRGASKPIEMEEYDL